MRKLTPVSVAFAMLVGSSVATFAAAGGSAPGAAVKGGVNENGAAGTADHSNTGTPSAAPPPTIGCGTSTNAMKQGTRC